MDSRIPFSNGVCGSCASSLSTQLVYNVHEFDGHIACDEASNSEIVIPLFSVGGGGEGEEGGGFVFVGVLDLDCPLIGGFSHQDQVGLERCCEIFTKNTDFSQLLPTISSHKDKKRNNEEEEEKEVTS